MSPKDLRRIFFFLLIFSIFFVFSANGDDTGYINLTDTTGYSYTKSGFSTGDGSPTSWLQLQFDTTDYNKFTSLNISGITSTWFYKISNASYGYCVSGCSGTIFGWYSKTGQQVGYDFSDDFTVTNPNVVLAFYENIFDGNNIEQISAGSTSEGVAASRPILIRTNANLAAIGMGFQYNAVVGTQTSEYYNVTYEFPNYFRVRLDKQGPINTLNRIKNNSNYYFWNESDFFSFNNVDKDAGQIHYTNFNGLYIQLYVASGASTIKLVNATGITGGGGGINTVTFTKSGYVVGEFPTINWSIQDYNSSYSYYLQLTNPINNSITLLDNIPTSGSTTSVYDLNTAGSWKSSIIALDNTCTLPTYYCWLPGDIAYAYTQVSSGESVLVANITANKTTYGYREVWNFTVRATGSNKYVIHAYDPDGYLFAVFPATATGVSGNQTILYSPISYTVNGTWTAKVYDIVNARHVAEVEYQIVPTYQGYYVGQLRILEEKINLEEQNYFTVDYTSNGSGTISILRPDQSVFSTINAANGTGRQIVSIPTDSALGYWTAALVDQSAAYSDQVMVTRNGTIVSQNGTFVIFADKTAYNRHETVKATYKFPANFNNLSLVLYDANSKMVASAKLPAPVQQVFGYAIVTIGTTGTSGIWTLALEDNNNTRYASTTFRVSSTAAATATPTPKSIAENTNSLMSGNFITIILIMFAFLGIGYSIGGFMGSVMGFGSGFIVLGVLELVPQWSLFLFAIIVITAFAVVGGKSLVSSGGKD